MNDHFFTFMSQVMMSTAITNYITHTANTDWKPLTEPGIDTVGIFVKVLRYHEQTGRAPINST